MVTYASIHIFLFLNIVIQTLVKMVDLVVKEEIISIAGVQLVSVDKHALTELIFREDAYLNHATMGLCA